MESCVTYSQLEKQSVIFLSKKGFSLIELLIVMAVMAIIIVLAAPSFQTIFMNSKLSTLSDALFNSLSYARATALSEKTPVQVCPFLATNSTSCGTSWSLGWIVVTQPSTGASVLLQSYQALTTGPVLSSPNSVTAVSFSITGVASAQADFKLCDKRGSAYALSLMVMPTGFIQSGPTAGQAVWNGSTLTCP